MNKIKRKKEIILSKIEQSMNATKGVKNVTIDALAPNT